MVPENDVDDSLDGLFDSSTQPRPADRPLRLWTDNTGRYSCRGRLVAVSANHVRIVKSNGRTTTVPLTRLRRADLGFVRSLGSVATLDPPTTHVAKK